MLSPITRISMFIIAASALAVASAHAADPAAVAETSKGKTLVDSNGMTLYTFDKDPDGKSACNGGCATNWPPLKVETDGDAPAHWSVVTRDDGSRQWAYMGKPLYTFIKDTKPGDTTGDGFLNGTWHVAQP